MGHFHTTMTVIAPNKEEASIQAVEDFFYEYGHRHDLREVESITKVEGIPPLKQVVTTHTNRYGCKTVSELSVRDEDAPKSEWWGKYEVVLHTHA